MSSWIGNGYEKWPEEILARRFETLLVDEPAPHVLRVTINRPEASNAFTTLTARELHDVFAPLEIVRTRFRCVLLTGAGDKAFCAGGDLKERKLLSEHEWVLQHELMERTVRAIVASPVPVVAAVNGAAYGGGLELALLCDFAYASRTARFALTETSLGIMPGAGGTQTLARAVGEKRAKELILAAKPFNAEQALAWGVVNQLCEPENLMAETLAIAERIAGNAPLAVRQAKHAIHHGLQQDLATGMHFEIEAYQRMVKSRDRVEGVAAFNEKRKPRFEGQ
ncbi:enoyl-CoA hydratase-related protein [uncultured Azohydromonas sp.]|jgi:Enoyl-CoA hydratase/carnithine racemase|uniref:enoyl-CoA hydratase-related protein n=1 Tax=uncultured Azohydromonas sp. TaxID=487342 RepID=UPI0026051536|nr:enoyl-CoA hydratase-related protein [uncultured Azohydromonas sp.]